MTVARILMTLTVAVIFMVGNCSAMQFSQTVEIGKIGYPRQAPIHGYIVNNATKNDGTYYEEKPSKTNGIGENFRTYVKGVAQFGQGDSALYCNYNFNEDFIKFGGKNNYVLTLDGHYKDIYKIDSDSGVVLYALHYHYTTTHLNIIGRQNDQCH